AVSACSARVRPWTPLASPLDYVPPRSLRALREYVRGHRNPVASCPRSTETPDWAAIERSAEFRALVRAKHAFIIPASLLFVVYYFALPALVGYWPGLMSRDVIGHINVAYLFALSQFGMAWALMAAYVRRAR